MEYSSLLGAQLPDDYETMNDSAKDKTLIKSKSKLGLFFLSFSFSRNLRKTFWSPQAEDDNLSILNGVRVVSMAYIIFGHTHVLVPFLPIPNFYEFNNLQTDVYTAFVMGALYSVDVFFFMSSFLGTYLMVEKFKGKSMNFIMIYFHRVLRIVPTIALFTALFMTIFEFLGSGPIWNVGLQNIYEPCKSNWWINIIFINNFYQQNGYG